MLRFSFERIFSVSNLTPEAGALTSLGLIFGPFINYFYGDGRGHFITALSMIILMDWITGVIASRKDGTYTSEYGIEGIFRTMVILMLPALANFLDKMLGTPGFLFYGITFGLSYHILQSFIANSVRAKWDKWIPNSVIEKAASEIKAKTIRAEKRKSVIEQSEGK
ncbi:phage holin family protein [Oceanobacillus profundus]|uniref:Holin n=1 Tax=Oceanobacillus profundus TaxID=372463 RepID=A0A417YGX9_9BACI|nr:phage holin family protein [Oceanobacillus profundus]MBR2245617.1 phage holin family protein [Bacilli bacterium]MBR3121335.1 phage holin family protein [Oceanobacillus sp.]RHW32024.1 holin [Oceanobacillus profundus]